MLLRYDGIQAKFSRHGQTWMPGDIIEIETTPQDAAWMLRHGFTQVFPAKQAKSAPEPDTGSVAEVFQSPTRRRGLK